MQLKLIVVVCVLAATPAFAQPSGTPPAAPKPTKADAQNVVQIISSDKAKTQIYCDLAKIDDQIAAAVAKKDQKKIDELIKQQDALGDKLGPEYVALTNGLLQSDPSSAEDKEISTLLQGLDKLCK